MLRPFFDRHSSVSTQSSNRRARGGLLLAASLFVTLAAGCRDGGEDARLARVRDLEQRGRIDQAIDLVSEVLSEDRDNPEANFLLGKGLIQTGRQSLAIPPLQRAAESEAFAIPAGLLLASTQMRLEAYDQAIATTDRLLERDPENLTALYAGGQSRLAANRPEEALAFANRILALKPQAQNAIIMKANALVALDRGEEAEKIWKDLRKEATASGDESRAARACIQLARFHRSQEDLEGADAIYRECLEEFPGDAALQRAASEFYVLTDRPERAVEMYRQAAEAAPDDIRSWSRLVHFLLDHGDPAEARKTIENVVERFDSPEAWRMLAEFHRRSRNTTEARKALEEAILRSPQPQEALLHALADLLVEEGDLDRAEKIGQGLQNPSYRNLVEGAILLASGDPEKALERIDLGLRSWPNNPRGHELAGEAALGLGRNRRALKEFSEAIRLRADATDAALRLAEMHFANGNQAAALNFAARQISQRPYLDPTAHHIAIRSALELGQIDRAREFLASLEAADPDAIEVVVEKAMIARKEGGAEASSAVLRASGLDLSDPENEPALRALADDLNALGRGEEALTLIDAAIARKQSAPLHDLRARVLSQLSRTEEAAAATDRALDLDPGYVPALEMKAYLALQKGDRETALAALDAATEAAPMQARHPYDAASIARESGDTAGAIARLEEALIRKPGFGPAAEDLAWILATDRSDLDRALSLARRAVRQTKSATARATLGWVLYQRGAFDAAIEQYRAALEMNPDLPSVRYRLGLALAAAGHEDEARAVLASVLEGPDFPEIEAARSELEKISGS
ncbi:MAG TPA: tetratricopeptide repeat protein [Deltaproteobacteria bacterium]|nr:tetratricopeptide repeat protein [Deltaproteobacteria bacterium]